MYTKDAEREADTELTQSRGRQSARHPFPTGDGCRALSPDDGEKGLFGFRSAHLFLIEVTLDDAVVGDGQRYDEGVGDGAGLQTVNQNRQEPALGHQGFPRSRTSA